MTVKKKAVAKTKAKKVAKTNPLIVRVARTGCDWDVRETERMTHDDAIAHVVKLNKEKFGGFSDWQLPTVEQLFLLADRTKTTSPVIDTKLFPDCKSNWYWSGTRWAPSPSDYAWFVGFGNGGSNDCLRSYSCFVRACRPSQ